ncbi:hypothetical protein H4Q26_009829 [Puccinia striiformis f. sp. tritici PST-130]|nr:hypothetical protein H4Q26_009829 [Puccinia striiformis f. sp. tritici PST-130]
MPTELFNPRYPSYISFGRFLASATDMAASEHHCEDSGQRRSYRGAALASIKDDGNCVPILKVCLDAIEPASPRIYDQSSSCRFPTLFSNPGPARVCPEPSKESGSQKSGHYNLKRLSMDFSQAPSSPLWYGKASENFEVQVRTALAWELTKTTVPNRDSIEALAGDNCGVERCHDANGDTDAETIGNFNHVPVNTRHGRRASHRHTYNLPNTKFCLGKDQVVIDYVDDISTHRYILNYP